MARPHLRQQAGGHPSQGPVREMANPDPAPAVGNDFPDDPDEAVDERPSDQPDLDEFAARIGTDRLADRDDRTGDRADADGEDDGVSLTDRVQRVRDGATSKLASLLSSASDGLRRLAERLDDRS